MTVYKFILLTMHIVNFAELVVLLKLLHKSFCGATKQDKPTKKKFLFFDKDLPIIFIIMFSLIFLLTGFTSILLSIINEQPHTNNFMNRKKKEFSLIILRNFMFMPTLKQTLTANSNLLYYFIILFCQ